MLHPMRYAVVEWEMANSIVQVKENEPIARKMEKNRGIERLEWGKLRIQIKLGNIFFCWNF